MKLLLDTQLLIWLKTEPTLLSKAAARLINAESSGRYFSAVSIWEVSIKWHNNRQQMPISGPTLRRALLDTGLLELSFDAHHGVDAGALPLLHKDPFDRALIAQARVEGFTLATADRRLAAYGAPVMVV